MTTHIVKFEFIDELGVSHKGEAFVTDLMWNKTYNIPFTLESFQEMQEAVTKYKELEQKTAVEMQLQLEKELKLHAEILAKKQIAKDKRLAKKKEQQELAALKLIASNTIVVPDDQKPMSPWTMIKAVFSKHVIT
jgi:hypothetical protein